MKLINPPFIKIDGFMTKELGLSGNDLVVYALIYGFTIYNGSYNGGIKYVMAACNLSKRTAIRVLNRLKEKELITINGNSCVATRGVKMTQNGAKMTPQRCQNDTNEVPKWHNPIIKNTKENYKGNKRIIEFDSVNTATDENMSKAINELAERLKS